MIYETPKLETERLILKRGTYEDFVKVYEYDFTRLRNINGEFEFVKYDPEKLKGYEELADEPYTIDFILYKKSDLIPIGNLTLDRYNSQNKSLEISVNLHPSYWRKGYMTEAVICAMDYVFRNLDIDNIIYSYAEKNYKSKGLSNKIGFDFYRVRIEHYIRIDKDIKEIMTMISKEKFQELYMTNDKLKKHI